jgi:transcriptional regulator with XRE-family HTH domain
MAENAIPIFPPNRLREIREAAGDSRVDVAQLLELDSDAQVQRWERGVSEIPIKHARVIAFRYGVSLSYLMRDENGGKAA